VNQSGYQSGLNSGPVWWSKWS